jgi:DNA-directed RNA polymerase specialized sigma54-like protein
MGILNLNPLSIYDIKILHDDSCPLYRPKKYKKCTCVPDILINGIEGSWSVDLNGIPKELKEKK